MMKFVITNVNQIDFIKVLKAFDGFLSIPDLAIKIETKDETPKTKFFNYVISGYKNNLQNVDAYYVDGEVNIVMRDYATREDCDILSAFLRSFKVLAPYCKIVDETTKKELEAIPNLLTDYFWQKQWELFEAFIVSNQRKNIKFRDGFQISIYPDDYFNKNQDLLMDEKIKIFIEGILEILDSTDDCYDDEHNLQVEIVCIYYKAVNPKMGMLELSKAQYDYLVQAEEMEQKTIACFLLDIPNMASYVKSVVLKVKKEGEN